MSRLFESEFSYFKTKAPKSSKPSGRSPRKLKRTVIIPVVATVDKTEEVDRRSVTNYNNLSVESVRYLTTIVRNHDSSSMQIEGDSQLDSTLLENTIHGLNSCLIATGNVSKNERLLRYTIWEYYGISFSIEIFVPKTQQNWTLFVPLSEHVKECLAIMLLELQDTAEYAKQLGGWLLSCTTLEFEDLQIIGANFDHYCFKVQYMDKILENHKANSKMQAEYEFSESISSLSLLNSSMIEGSVMEMNSTITGDSASMSMNVDGNERVVKEKQIPTKITRVYKSKKYPKFEALRSWPLKLRPHGFSDSHDAVDLQLQMKNMKYEFSFVLEELKRELRNVTLEINENLGSSASDDSFHMKTAEFYSPVTNMEAGFSSAPSDGHAAFQSDNQEVSMLSQDSVAAVSVASDTVKTLNGELEGVRTKLAALSSIFVEECERSTTMQESFSTDVELETQLSSLLEIVQRQEVKITENNTLLSMEHDIRERQLEQYKLEKQNCKVLRNSVLAEKKKVKEEMKKELFAQQKQRYLQLKQAEEELEQMKSGKSTDSNSPSTKKVPSLKLAVNAVVGKPHNSFANTVQSAIAKPVSKLHMQLFQHISRDIMSLEEDCIGGEGDPPAGLDEASDYEAGEDEVDDWEKYAPGEAAPRTFKPEPRPKKLGPAPPIASDMMKAMIGVKNTPHYLSLSEEDKAALCIQSFIRSRMYSISKTRNNSTGSSEWVREVAVNSAAATTKLPHVLIEGIQLALKTNNILLTKKLAARIFFLCGEDIEYFLKIPLEMLVQLLTAFVHDLSVADLGLRIFHLVEKTEGKEKNTSMEEVCASDVSLQNAVIAAGGINFMIQSINMHISNPKLCFKATKAIYVVSADCTFAQDRLAETTVCESLNAVLMTYKKNRTVVGNCLRCIMYICQGHAAGLKCICDAGLCSTIMELISYNPLEKDVYRLAKAIIFMTSIDEYSKTTVQSLLVNSTAICQCLVNLVKRNVGHVKFLDRICLIIYTVVEGNEHVRKLFIKAGACEVLLECISQDSLKPSSLRGLCSIIPFFVAHNNEAAAESIRSWLLDMTKKRTTSEKLKAEINAMNEKIATLEYTIKSFGALTRAAVLMQSLARKFLHRWNKLKSRAAELLSGDSVEFNLVMESMILAMKLRDVHLARKAAKTIFTVLSSDNFSSVDSVYFGYIGIMVLFFNKFLHDERTTELSMDIFSAIAKICEKMDGEKECSILDIFCSQNFVEYLVGAVEIYGNDHSLVFKISRCLSIAAFRNRNLRIRLAQPKWCSLLKHLMDKQRGNPSLLENFFRIIIHMSMEQTTANQSLLGEAGICAVLVDILKERMDISRLVSVCSLCIVALASQHNNNKSLFTEKLTYCQVFLSALSINMKFPRVMDQLYWCIITISANHPFSLEQFVKAGLFQLLLEFLTNNVDDPQTFGQTAWAFLKLSEKVTPKRFGFHSKIIAFLKELSESAHSLQEVKEIALKALKVLGKAGDLELQEGSAGLVMSEFPDPSPATPLAPPESRNVVNLAPQGSSVIDHFPPNPETGDDDEREKDAAVVIQRVFMKRIKGGATSSFSRETALLRIVSTSDNHLIILEALLVSVSNRNPKLGKIAAKRTLEFLNSELEKRKEESADEMIERIKLDAESLPETFAVAVLEVQAEFPHDDSLCEVVFDVLNAVIRINFSLSMDLQERCAESMVKLNACSIVINYLQNNKKLTAVGFKMTKLLCSLASFSKSRAILSTPSSIKMLGRLMAIHRNKASMIECLVTMLTVICNANEHIKLYVGEHGICRTICKLLPMYVTNKKIFILLCKCVCELSCGCEYNQNIFSSKDICEKWVYMIVDIDFKESSAVLEAALSTMLCSSNGSIDEGSNNSGSVERREEYRKAGILLSANALLQGNTLSPRSVTSLLAFIHKMLPTPVTSQEEKAAKPSLIMPHDEKAAMNQLLETVQGIYDMKDPGQGTLSSLAIKKYAKEIICSILWLS